MKNESLSLSETKFKKGETLVLKASLDEKKNDVTFNESFNELSKKLSEIEKEYKMVEEMLMDVEVNHSGSGYDEEARHTIGKKLSEIFTKMDETKEEILNLIELNNVIIKKKK